MKDLRYKLLLQFIVVSVVLLLGYTYIWVTITKEQIIQASQKEVQVAAEHANTILQSFFETKIAELTTFTYSTTQTKEEAEKIISNDHSISWIVGLSSTGEKQLITQNATFQTNPTQTPEFKIASFMGGQTYISPVFQDKGKEYVTIAIPNKTSGGVLIAKVQATQVMQQFQKMKVGKSGKVSLITNKSDTKESSDVYQVNDALVFHKVNALSGWSVMAHHPLADILEPLNQVIIYSIFLFVAAVILTILLSLTLANGVVTSFKGLKAGFENFNKGNLAFRIPINNNDEISDLSKSFNRMIGDIHEAYLKVDREKAVVLAEKQQAEKSFADEKVHMQHVLEDDREKVNNGLFVEKEKVNAIMANITDAVILLNKQRQIMFFNKVAEDLLGHSSKEMQHKLITAAMKVYEKDTEVTWDEYAPMQNMGEVNGNVLKKEKVRIENSSISPRFVKMLTVKTNFNQSDDLGFIIILHNLDSEMELEKTEMKFVGAVTRELQAPVAILLQCFPFLKKDTADMTEKMYATGVQTGIDQLTTLMQNFILATKLEEHAIKPVTESVDMITIIKEIIGVITPQMQVKQLQLAFQEPENPLSPVAVDGANIRDVLLNLFSNAIKFTPAQGIITINVHQLENEVLVEIQDTGPGIPKDVLPNLFKKFYTIPNASGPDVTGSGLGLFTAKSLIELNHGKIWADSVEGKGSTFGFSLPKAT